MLKISDDFGFLAIVDASKYNSFFDEEWNFEQLSRHFVNKMNARALVIWATNEEGKWTVELITELSNRTAYKEFSVPLVVTDNKLVLTNYEDLTMAASYRDESIPSTKNADLFFNVNNGNYDITIRQLFDPKKDGGFSEVAVHFEVFLKATKNTEIGVVDRIPWFEE